MPIKKTITPQALAGITNAQFWDECRKNNANFANTTSAGTQMSFDASTFEAIKASDIGVLNKFFELSLRVAFQKVDPAAVHNPLADAGLVEMYNTPNGGFVQRIAVDTVNPISPVYNDLTNGSSVDPFKVRKPKTRERFFEKNYDYQSLITIQEYQVRQIFLDEFGMGQYISGIMQGLENGRVKQEYVNILQALNAGLNSTTYPLKNSQKIKVDVPDDLSAVTDEQLKAMIESIMDLMTGIRIQVSSGQYNAAGFDSYVDPSDYIMMMRAGILNRIKTRLRVGAFNPEDLAIPIDKIVEVSDFGGLVPYREEAHTTRLYPVYDSFGATTGYYVSTADAGSLVAKTDSDGNVIGYITTGDPSAISNVVASDSVHWLDENAEVKFVVAQKGLIFENIQNPYVVNPIYNPAGLYTNYWASSPNNSINYDYNYNVIVGINK